MLLSIGQLAKELGVHIETIRRWDKEGKIKAVRTTGGHRRFDVNQVKAMLDNEKLKDKRVTVIYARVSTPNRKDDLNRQIDEVLEQLNEREQAVVRMRFGLLNDKSDRTLEEIGKELSVTRERVRQIESSAIKKLKHPKVGRKLKNYIEE